MQVLVVFLKKMSTVLELAQVPRHRSAQGAWRGRRGEGSGSGVLNWTAGNNVYAVRQ